MWCDGLFISEMLLEVTETQTNDCEKSEYGQKIPQSHAADQPTTPRGRATEH